MEYVSRTLLSVIVYCIKFNAVRFAVGRLEVPIIALALYAVQMNLLGGSGFERFLLSWLGVLVLSWTLRTILRLDEAWIVLGKIRGGISHPDTRAVLSRMGVPFVEFCVDMLIVVTAMMLYQQPSHFMQMVLSAIFVIVAQGAVNAALMVIYIWIQPRFDIKNALTVMFFAFALMSPVLFMFHDLHQFGDRYFTSFNPASHFLAAYYNIFWFGVPISLRVLPLILIVSAAIIFTYWYFVEPQIEEAQVCERKGQDGVQLLSFRRFNERGSISGLELFFTLYAMGKQPIARMESRAREIMALPEYHDQLSRSLSTYSRLNDMHLDLLLAACLSGGEETHLELPDDEIYHVTKTKLNNTLAQVNAIMGTKLSISEECLQKISD